MLRLVMDSGGDVPVEWMDTYEIHIIPVNVHMGDKVFLEDVNLSVDDFYRWVEETGEIPKSSQPSPEQFKKIYREIAEPGDVILSIHLTSKLSGTYESAVIAARDLEDEPFEIIPFDSLSGTAIQGYMCCEARVMYRQGASMEEILDRLADIRDQCEVVFALDSLDFAQKSGRVNRIEYLLAFLLRVKPIIHLEEGMLEIGKKVRTRVASLEFIITEMARRIGDIPVHAAVMHAHDLATALDFAETVKERLNVKRFFVEEVSTGIAANLGPGTIGIVAYPIGEGVF
ncbi:MAG: DegV family protein [Anaerolineales bacterium]